MKKIIYKIFCNYLDLPWQYLQSNGKRQNLYQAPLSPAISPILKLSNAHYLFNYAGAYVITFLLTLPFLPQPYQALVIAFFLAFPLSYLLNHYAGIKKLKQNEAAFIRFLQEIIGLLRNGQSLENALVLIVPRFATAYGENNPLVKLLQQLCKALEAGWTLADLENSLKTIFPHNVAANYFSLLRERQALGNQLLKISLQFEKNLLAKKHLEQEIAGNNAQQRMEACILFLLPFIILYILRFGQSDFFQPALSTMPGPFMLLGAFVLICLAGFFIFRLSLPSAHRYKDKSTQKENKIIGICTEFTGLLLPHLQTLLPLVYQESITRHLQIVAASQSQDIKVGDNYSLLLDEHKLLCRHFAEKLIVITGSLLLSVLLALAASEFLYLLPFIVFGTAFLHDQELINKSISYQEAVMLVFPWDFSLLLMLLANQYSLINAFAELQKLLSDDDLLKNKFYKFWQNALLGEFSLAPFFHWANKLQTPDLVNAVAALKNYQANGNPKNLSALEQQCQDLFKSSLRQQKVRIAKRQSFLIIPMTLDLLAVLLITLAPVLPGLSL